MPTPLRSYSDDHASPSDTNVWFVAAAIVLSIVLHIAIAIGTGHMRFSFFGYTGLSTEELRALREESALRARIRMPSADSNEAINDLFGKDNQPEAAAAPTTEELLQAHDDKAEDALLLAAPAALDAFADEPPNAAAVDLPPPAELLADLPAPDFSLATREAILEIAEPVAPDVGDRPRRIVPPIERFAGAPDVTEAAPLRLPTPEEAARASAPDWTPPAPAASRENAKALDDAIAAAAPAASTVAAQEKALAAPDSAVGAILDDAGAETFVKAPEPTPEVKAIESVLRSDISVYRPAQNDGYLYFSIDIQRRAADVLPAIPRDVLLVVDSSSSIPEPRLRDVRGAFHAILANGLRPGDRYDIVAFSETTSSAFGNWTNVGDAAALATADKFLAGLRPWGRTDLYTAISTALDRPRDRNRALVVFLATDGKTTEGAVRRDAEIIANFSRANAGAISVYDVGVAPGSNEYLLSMLSFCNRGGMASAGGARYSSANAIVESFGRIGTPVLTNVRFLFDSDSKAVVTPAATENLRLEQPLRLYGRAPVGTRDVTFQVLGENRGQTYDMVFRLPLGNPAPGSGDAALAERWARTRVYDLIARRAKGPDADADAEMSYLAVKYKFPVPFSK